ncbi:hypothetical protein FISHEDRAFT_26859, partial [Fistulina hepatica ATCC 64428]
SMEVTISPKAGFCVKSRAGQLKVFLNIAWDKQIPAPPTASEDVIRRAMTGQAGSSSDDDWYVPVVVSEGRKDTDKAGKPALVFDCVFHPSLKTRALTDLDFKSFLIELSLQNVEAQSGQSLSRQIGTPNIASKGKVMSRTVRIPQRSEESSSERPKIEEIESTSSSPTPQPVAPPKGILKRPKLSWQIKQQLDGDKIRNVFVVDIPFMTRTLHSSTTLDIEPHRILLHVPEPHPSLDLDLSDPAAASAGAGLPPHYLERFLPLDVPNARAEWRVAEGKMYLWV